jgi:prepilin-type N-terminal cleavage/methylation domain-containing protein/prepilin-type processing-associated H-X9-DG protein
MKQNCISGHPHRESGFTLIELLTVIAIISLLAAILFPVFSRARENARRASCMSNLKQIGLAMLQYTQDYDEKFPLGWTSTTQPRWDARIDPYLKSRQIFVCPSASQLSIGYGCNMWAVCGGAVTVGTATVLKSISQAEFSRSAEVWMVTESTGDQRIWQYSLTPGSGSVERVAERHFDGVNCVFVDGHVKWVRYEILSTNKDDIWGNTNK